MGNCVTIKNLKKIFNGSYALSDINLKLEYGTITALLGADGAGKTTLLRLIAGLLCEKEGEIITLGYPSDKKELFINNLGYMPQKFGLYEDLTVEENLNFYAKLKKDINEKDDKTDYEKILDFTTLKPFKKRLAGALSGGMKQKLGLACALLGKPKLLILDEPSVGVDPLSRQELLELVKNMITKDTCVIWSTSYLDEAYGFSNCIILDKGKLIFKGKTEELAQDFNDFQNKVINLMGGYNKQNSTIAANYNIYYNSDDCYVLAQNLSKKFKDFWAVKNNSFCIKRGKIFGLLGPNGAGKTTTFQMMCGLIKPTSGKRYIMGVDVDKNPTRARNHLGYMAQKFSLYSKLSVNDNLNFFAGIYGLYGKKKKENIQKIIDLFELKQYKNTICGLLPLGFKQRLSLACALIHEPSVLFLDEPTSGVDIIHRYEFWTHIKKLSEIGVSTLVTTHFMEEADFCDEISLFFNGEIIALDTPENLFQKTNSKNMSETFIKLIKKARADK